MEFCDVSVRVLYDFEYTTKYGRNIKITAGERLLLIKKTNNDWWQVIRSSEQRPFFVPATYVEEIKINPKLPTKDLSSPNYSPKKPISENSISPPVPRERLKNNQTNVSSNKIVHGEVVHNEQNFSFKADKALCSNSKKETTNLLSQKQLSSTMSSSGYNSLCEEIALFEEEEGEEHFNQIGDNSSHDVLENESHPVCQSRSDNKQQSDVIIYPPDSDKELSVNRVNISSNSKLYDSGKYSMVSNSVKDVPEYSSQKIIYGLPPSDSLENLSLQIELKTSCTLGNVIDKNNKSLNTYIKKSVFDSSSSEVSENNIGLTTDQSSIAGKNRHEVDLKNKLETNLPKIKCTESKSSENVNFNVSSSKDKNSLQYHGSFKTNIERQRWFKKSNSEQRLRNVFSCSEETRSDIKVENTHSLEPSNVCVDTTAVQENESTINTAKDICEVASNDQLITCGKIDEVLQQGEAKARSLQSRHYFGSDSQLSYLRTSKEKTNSRHSLDSVVESDVREDYADNSDKIKCNKKERSPLVANILTKENSEVSSNDSLLEIENEGSFRKISGGTTSDSLVPTDGEDLITSESETDSLKLARNKQETKNVGAKNRKIQLTRRRRVFASKSRFELNLDPPSPGPSQVPSRVLGDGWNEYDTQDGRKYFYNSETKEKRWKPPRRTQNTNVDPLDEEDSVVPVETNDMFVVSMSLPDGWKSEIDPVSKQTCYVHISSGIKWFSSTDNEGRVYFFEENSNKSSWTLPNSSEVSSQESKPADVEGTTSLSHSPVIEKSANRSIKSKSMILATRYEESTSLSSLSQNWPHLLEGTMCVLKEGALNKTKITENGKRVRKNWSSTYAVLTELLLLFFKDNKGFPSMMNGSGRPELSVDLNGAVIDPGDKVSSRKNVYMLSTVLGLQVLIQCDCAATADQWLSAIQSVINNLPLSMDAKGQRVKSESPLEESKLNSRIVRSKSMKLKQKSASIEDLSVNIAERQIKIRERLKKFFNRRPTVDLLVKKGIWKDEPVFGCLLEHVCPSEPPRVPLFVQHCIRCIERSEENMKTDGLYRASGNLSQVQKIRLQVDQNIYSLIDQEEDVHVLAGTLKLFFRELKQPLIPFKFFKKAISASTNLNRTEKIRDFRDIVKSLPLCNYDTLKFLLQHLLRVTQYHEFNRMHIPNIAIVFGPTLMWPEQESLNMAFDLMQQNLVIECFLSEFQAIFH